MVQSFLEAMMLQKVFAGRGIMQCALPYGDIVQQLMLQLKVYTAAVLKNLPIYVKAKFAFVGKLN